MEETVIRAALDRVTASEAFQRSARCTALLRYIVEEHLNGREHLLQGTTIAQDVFGRDEAFDSNTDPIVRVQASRLRNLLEAYYRGPGAGDPLVISVPKGGYAPKFVSRPNPEGEKAGDSSAPNRPPNGSHLISLTRLSMLAAAIAVIFFLSSSVLKSDPEPALQVPNGPKIHVIEFSLVGHDANASVISKGFQIELIHQLSRFKNLFVYGPDVYAGPTNEDLVEEQNGNLAEPDFTLSGTIEISSANITITTQLLDVESSTIVWSEKFIKAVSASDQFTDLKESIVSEVAAALGQPYGVIQGHLSREAESGAAKVSFGDYVCLCHFYDYARKKSAQGHALVRDCLETATSRTPNFSSGWAALSWIYGDEERYGFNQSDENQPAFDRALEAARKAVEADPYNDMAHEYLAVALFMQGNHEGFRRAAETALSLNPNNTESLASFGRILIILDGSSRGKALAEKAIKLNPGHPPWFHMGLAIYYYQTEEFEAANLHASAYHEDESAFSKILMAAICARAGMNDLARNYWIDFEKTYPEIARNPKAFIEKEKLPSDLIESLEADLSAARALYENA